MLRKLRKGSGYERMFVAKKLNINPEYFNRIETGQGSMPIERAKILANLYGVNENQILKIWRQKNEEYIKKGNGSKEGTVTNEKK